MTRPIVRTVSTITFLWAVAVGVFQFQCLAAAAGSHTAHSIPSLEVASDSIEGGAILSEDNAEYERNWAVIPSGEVSPVFGAVIGVLGLLLLRKWLG